MTMMKGGVAHFCLNIPSSYQNEVDHRNKAFIYQKHSAILFLSKIQTNYIPVEDKALTPPHPPTNPGGEGGAAPPYVMML